MVRLRAASAHMRGDKLIHIEPHRPRAAITIMPLEVNGLLVPDKLASCIDEKALHFAVVCGPCIEDNAISRAAVLVGKTSAALDPGFGLFLAGESPADKSPDLACVIDDEAVMPTVDLADEDPRPITKSEVGKGRFRHQVVDRDTEGRCRIARAKQSQLRLL